MWRASMSKYQQNLWHMFKSSLEHQDLGWLEEKTKAIWGRVGTKEKEVNLDKKKQLQA